jgi:RNA recognition motif-containing protein
MQNRLYVGNLAMDVAASSLQELFEPYGFVMDVSLPSKTEAGSRRAAFVTMATDESARAAIGALNGAALHGVAITVKVAHEEGAQ